MKRCAPLLLLLAMLCTPALAQSPQLATYLQNLIVTLQSGNVEQASAIVLSDQNMAAQSFAFVMNGYSSGQVTQQELPQVIFLLNFISRVSELGAGRTDFRQQLSATGLLLPDSQWAGTPLQGGGQTAGTLRSSEGGGSDAFMQSLKVPTSSLEARSGLLEDESYLQVKMAISIGAYLAAARLLEQMQTNSALSPDQQNLLILRTFQIRSAMADTQWLDDLAAVESLARNLPPDARLGLYLCVCHSAGQRVDMKLFDTYRQKIGSLSAGLPADKQPLAKAMYESMSFELDALRNPDMPVAEMTRRWKQMVVYLTSTPKNAGQPPLLWRWALDEVGSTWFVIFDRRSAALGAGSPQAQPLTDAVGQAFPSLLAYSLSSDHQNLDLTLSALGMLLELARMSPPETARGLLTRVDTQLELLRKINQQIQQYGNTEEQRKVLRSNEFTRLEAIYKLALAEATLHEFEDKKMPLDRYQQAYGDAQSAYELFEAATDIKNALEVVQVLALLGQRAKPEGWAKNNEMLTSGGIQIARELDSFGNEVWLLYHRANARRALGNSQGAIQDLTRARDRIEEFIVRLGGGANAASSTRELTSEIYNMLTELQLESGNQEEALATLNRKNQLSSVGSIDLGKLKTTNKQAAPKVEAVKEAQARTEALQKELQAQKSLPQTPETQRKVAHTSQLLAQSKAEFTLQLDSLKKQLGPGYDRFLSVKPMQFTRLQKSIPANAAVLQAFYTPEAEKLHLFVITSSQFRVRSVEVSGEDLTKLVRKFRRQLTSYARAGGNFSWDNPQGQALKSLLVELHSILIDPVEADIADEEVITFIPGGILYYLPLQALARENNGKLEFLVERKKVVTLSRATDLSDLKTAAAGKGGNLVAFGNPDGSLPAASQEVIKLKGLFPDAQVYVEKEATQEKLLAMHGAGYLHLATHGVLNGQQPDASYLVLSGAEEAGKLTRYEIIGNLDLEGTRLVTLSACETILGDKSPGNELTSIAESFWAAGSTAVVASLWKVSDESTQALMVEFYRRIKAGEDLAGAMQGAQVQLLKNPKYAHPHHWAPFVLWGDWR